MMAQENNVLVIGSGGREHAICWKLSQSQHVRNIFCAPGSYGISQTPKVTSVNTLNLADFQAIIEFSRSNAVSLVVVGPEDPLANGLADALNDANIKCFGPVKAGAKIESNKDWAKAFMVKYGIPTARYQSFTDAEEAKRYINSAGFPALVVKASGLAAGKGVVVGESREEACAAVQDMLVGKRFGEASSTVVVEELLEGDEVSVLAFTDGCTVRVMLPAQDHKRVGEGDTGPNTGGMGAYCPCPLISETDLQSVVTNVLEKAVAGLRQEGIHYVGVLYAGMMLTPNGPMTLEFNCRFGDPETQVLLPMLDSDLYLIMEACCNGSLHSADVTFKSGVYNVGVVMASQGYPETSTKGCVISGVSIVGGLPGHMVFHSGTSRSSNGALVTNGGRVLLVCAQAPTLRAAASLATAGCKQIAFPGAHFRKDIAHKAISKYGNLSYLDSGVDTEAGKTLVRAIEPAARASHRSGVLGRMGCFGGLFHINNNMMTIEVDGSRRKFQDPLLVEATDGVGTKLKIADALNKYDTIGVDLVAMCVNDILCAGAEPFAFLDYIACGKLDVEVAATIVEGIAMACKQSGCSLLGGETAEMPTMYEIGKYDLAGFAVGIVENSRHLPKVTSIFSGDIVLGIPSTGVHSNGFSLVQKIIQQSGRSYCDIAPFSKNGLTLGEELLTPTGLYVKALLSAVKSGKIKALAHITGGGLLENIPRVLPAGVSVRLDAKKFPINPVFGWIAAMGGISEVEMLRTFNCGVGMIAVVSPQDVDNVLALIQDYPVHVIGAVENRINGNHQVIVDNFQEAFEPLISPYRTVNIPIQALSYKDSGVDIDAGDNLVGLIKPLARSTTRQGCLGGLGGFGGLFRMNEITSCYKDPVLVMAANGVGTKLRIAQEYNKHDTVGMDLVAMCVNDILCNGGEPLTFLDYYACGSLEVKVAKEVIAGIADGCKEAKCALIGGETAEMPGMYKKGVYDIAGFALGAVERSNIMPKLNEINVGDSVIGLPSNGLHSNGFSLVHKIMEKNNISMSDKAPFSEEGLTYAEEFLKPTKIYADALVPVIAQHKLKAVAHITSGGLVGSISRALPGNVRVRIDSTNWHVHPVFGWIADTGNVEDSEMIGTFNCGLGMVLIVSPEEQADVMNLLRGHGAMVIGWVQARPEGGQRVLVDQFSSSLEYIRNMPIMPRKRVGVLISGSGTNLQALIDATRDVNQGILADVVLVISNKEDAYGLERAKQAGIPTQVISHKGYTRREDYDLKLTAALDSYKVDLICLAGFMRILSAEFVNRWKGRLVNIHPSLLPKHKGMNAQKQALDAGDTESGCSVHFVDDGVDTGPVIVQERVVIVGGDTVETLSERIHHAEHRAYPRALKLLAGGRVRLGPDNRLLHIY